MKSYDVMTHIATGKIPDPDVTSTIQKVQGQNLAHTPVLLRCVYFVI